MTTDTNPFKAMVYDGVQMYHQCADDRVRAVASFGRAECDAALQLSNLQKTVVVAVQRRLRYFEKVAAQLEFEDHGQDFLRWDLDAKGKVIGCEPFQAFVWVGLNVMCFQKLKAGDTVFYERRDTGGKYRGSSINYPLKKVTFLKQGPASTQRPWKAVCPTCGQVEILQNTKPTSCKTEIAVSAVNTRRCGGRLTQQERA